tara:strand:+ start:4827 stop:5273 length:447 start_codon:yes stop_codon:yes gene_type:complete
MFPKALIFAIVLGSVSGPLFGIFLYEFGIEEQLVFIDGTSLSIVTEKINFELGELISIRIVNSGTEKLQFSDSSYGLVIKQLDGIPVFEPESVQTLVSLDSHQEKKILWKQLKNNGEPILEGVYKISVKANTINGDVIEKIVTVNIFK